MEDSDAEADVGGQQELNVDPSGSVERRVETGATLCFVTVLEIVALLVHRTAQLDALEGPAATIDPRIVRRLGGGASVLNLMLAEILDPQVEYPLAIVRGGTPLRLHHDLKVIPEIVDWVVLSTEKGEVSYDPVVEDLRRRPGASLSSLEREIEDIAQISCNMRNGKLF